MNNRIPPNDLVVEGCTLTAAMIDNEQLGLICSLPREVFHSEANRHVFDAIKGLYADGLSVDYVSVSSRMQSAKTLDLVGGVCYLTGLDDGTTFGLYAPTYVQLLKEKYAQRQIIQAAAKVLDAAYDSRANDEVIYACTDDLNAAMAAVHGTVYRTDDQRRADAWANVSAYTSGATTRVHTPTGYRAIDEMIGGLEPATLTILGARPSMGKTAFALKPAISAAKIGVPVLFFSLESTTESLNQRMIAIESGISAERLKSGQLTTSEIERKYTAMAELRSLPLYIIDNARCTVADIARAIAKYKPRLVFVDFLQLMTTGKESFNKQAEVSIISRGLKVLSMTENTAIVVLSQLSRAVESRPNKRPMLSDLRESGSIEQDANNVWLLYRDDYYNPESEHQGVAEVIIAKYKDGATGTAKLSWDASRTRFSDLN